MEDTQGKLSIGAMLRLTEPPRSEPTVTDLAQWFIDHEIAVVPADGKTPIGGVTAAKLSVNGIKNGYGVALGNGLIGVDFDEYHGASNLDLFGNTRMWRSGSGKGYGIIYRVPKELSEHGFNWVPGIAFRAKNQILIGPGSKHPDGGTYTLVNDVDVQEAPEWIIKILEAKIQEVNSVDLSLGELVKPERFYTDKNWLAKFEADPIDGERYRQVNALVWYSIEKGATNEELAWIISNHRPAIAKGPAWLKSEIPREIKKARLLHDHPGKPCDSAGCKNKPDWMTKAVEVIDFFSARPQYTYIKQAAQSRLVSPKAVFIATLCRLAAAIPTEIVLPPIVGSKASLNFFACFVGAASDGKGTSTRLAEELFDFKQTGVSYTTSTPGSGEGVVSTYLKIKDNRWQQSFESALVNFDEIDNLKASSDRQGSTLSAILRQAFMGEQIGGTYSRAVKELLPHSYRMALQLSAQPLRSASLLDDADGGLPQRFVFVQTANAELPNVDDLPSFPDRMEWTAPKPILDLQAKKKKAKEPNPVLGKMDSETPIEKQYIEIELDPTIIREIRIRRIERLRTSAAGINGHEDLVHLKVATLLAILDGRLNVTVEDAMLAKTVMHWSRQALNEIKEALAHKSLKDQTARATAAADRHVFIEKRAESNAVSQVAENLIKWAKTGITKVSGAGNLRTKIKADKRMHIDDAIEQLVKEGKISYDEKTTEITLK